MKRRRRIIHSCRVCGTQFERRPCETGAFCSKACWANRNPPPPRQCGHCGGTFTTYDKKAKFCSRRCARKNKTGPLSNAWKGGTSLNNERAKASEKLTEWRNAVYLRDRWTCVFCGTKGKIHAHHKKPWATHPELRFDVDNGITLCIKCHGDMHGRDFTRRRVKTCPRCSKPTKGRGKACRSCSIKAMHANRRASPPSPQLHLF